MKTFRFFKEHLSLTYTLFRWTLLSLPLALTIGSAVALFVKGLDLVTQTRFRNEWLIYMLPVAGLFIAWLYHTFGKDVEKGNNLIVEEIHNSGSGVPPKMGPLILISTWVTHLFGGSAGREGTAVQIGGSISGLFSRILKLKPVETRILLMAGIAGGFGAVFGTPVAGTIFAMEVLTIGRIQYDALIPCLVSAIVGDMVCRVWGVHHELFALSFNESSVPLSLYNPHLLLLAKVVAAGAAFGLAALLFAEMEHKISSLSKHFIKSPYLRPVFGGFILIGLIFLLGRDYIGLGVYAAHSSSVTLFSAFHTGGAEPLSWFWKLLLTAITLGTGFKGGEVTPMFFIGATLGNVVAVLLDAPVDLFAALGFIAVFAGAANTPSACTIMGVELFGSQFLMYYIVVCFTAYFFSGYSGIYASQRIGIPKLLDTGLIPESTLRELSQRKEKIKERYKKIKRN